MKQQKSFEKKYKDIKIGTAVGIVIGTIFLLIATIQMITNAIDPPSIFLLIAGFCFSFYSFILFLLYWKFNKYQKKEQTIPKYLRIISGIFLIFSLAFEQIEKENQRNYLLLKEWKFYILNWLCLNILVGIFEIYAIKHNQTFWVLLAFLIINVFWVIALILMIFIWKYHGTKSKLLVLLTILTLNYRNYQLYKKIIELNKNEQKE